MMITAQSLRNMFHVNRNKDLLVHEALYALAEEVDRTIGLPALLPGGLTRTRELLEKVREQL